MLRLSSSFFSSLIHLYSLRCAFPVVYPKKRRHATAKRLFRPDSCRDNEQCEKSRQSTMGSLLTNRRIALTFHSATARMSEGKAGANGALRVEFSTFLGLHGAPHKLGKLASWGVYCKFYLGGGSAQARGTNFQGSLHQALRVGSAQTPGQAEPVFTRPRVLRFRLRAARLLIASRPNAPL